jgi:hypothetical protein
MEVARDMRHLLVGTTASDLNQWQFIELYDPAIPLSPTEELGATMSAATAGTAGILVFALGPETLPEPPPGRRQIVRCTGTTTLVANAWTTVDVTPEIALEPGTYALVDFYPASATAIAARALIPGQAWRPGKIAHHGGTDIQVLRSIGLMRRLFPKYNMGLFTHMTTPDFQFFATAADTSQTVFIEIVRVA